MDWWPHVPVNLTGCFSPVCQKKGRPSTAWRYSRLNFVYCSDAKAPGGLVICLEIRWNLMLCDLEPLVASQVVGDFSLGGRSPFKQIRI